MAQRARIGRFDEKEARAYLRRWEVLEMIVKLVCIRINDIDLEMLTGIEFTLHECALCSHNVVNTTGVVDLPIICRQCLMGR